MAVTAILLIIVWPVCAVIKMVWLAGAGFVFACVRRCKSRSQQGCCRGNTPAAEATKTTAAAPMPPVLPSDQAHLHESLRTLLGLGFLDVQRNVAALSRSGGDINQAVGILLEQ